jgi:hypothetical protein
LKKNTHEAKMNVISNNVSTVSLSEIANAPTATTIYTSGIDVTHYEGEVIFILSYYGGTGVVTDTVTITLQKSPDDDAFTNVESFPQFTGDETTGAHYILSHQSLIGKYVRLKVVGSVAGTPGHLPAYCVTMLCQKKYLGQKAYIG